MSLAVSTTSQHRRICRWLPGTGDTSVDFLWVLLAVTLVRGVIYAVLNPPFGSPDERDHVQYVRYLATFGRSGEAGVESSQPIPYYALMVPAYWLTAGQSTAIQDLAIRLASLPFLPGIVLFTWLAGRKMAPGKPFVPVVAAAFVGLHPQLAYIGASANNDNAANFMAAVLTYGVVSLFSSQPSRVSLAGTAAAIGAALMTKGQILPVVAAAVAVLLGRLGQRSFGVRSAKLYLYLAGGIGIAFLALTTARGAGLAARAWHVLSVSLSPQILADPIAQRGLDPFSYQFASFWGAFLGEALRPADPWYMAPLAILVLGAVGYLIQSRPHLRDRSSPVGSCCGSPSWG